MLAAAGSLFVPSAPAWPGQPEVAAISDALTQADAALRSVPDREVGRLIADIGLARVRLLLLQGDRKTAKRDALMLSLALSPLRDDALMNVAFAEVAAGDVEAAVATSMLVGGSFSPEAPVAYVAWAAAKAGNIARALEIVHNLRRYDSREMAVGDIAATRAESGDVPGAMATVDILPTPSLRAVALADVALVRFQANDRANATAILGQADSLVRKTFDPQWNYALQVLAAVHGKMRDFAGARAVVALGETSDLRNTMRWNLAIAHAEAGDITGALRADLSSGRDGRLAASLAEGGHLEAAREALRGVWDSEQRVEATRHVAIAFGKRGRREESAKLFADARRIASKLRDPLWRECRLRKVAVAQAEVGFDSEALATASMIDSIRHRRQAQRGIAGAQARNGRFAQAVTWATGQPDPLTRGTVLLGAAEGALEAAGYSDVTKIKIDRYARRSNPALYAGC